MNDRSARNPAAGTYCRCYLCCNYLCQNCPCCFLQHFCLFLCCLRICCLCLCCLYLFFLYSWVGWGNNTPSQKLHLADIHQGQIFPFQVKLLHRLLPSHIGCNEGGKRKADLPFLLVGGRIWGNSWPFPGILFPCIMG